MFGLLGPNGAGKSTTFNMLTMAQQRSGGECKIHDYSIDDLDIYSQGITMGMCPQHNTIWEQLTVDQTLWHIGEIKGLSRADLTT